MQPAALHNGEPLTLGGFLAGSLDEVGLCTLESS
jgi:hypothetical protein